MAILDTFTGVNTDIPGLNNLNSFNSYFENRYYDPFIRGYAFVFITKPSLFIYPIKSTDAYQALAYDNVCRDPYFSQYITGETMNEQDRLIMEQLSYVRNFSGSSYFKPTNFLPIFTNLTKNFESIDVNLEVQDVFETKQGWRMTMPTFTTSSETASQITLAMDESMNLDLTKMVGLWVHYISNIADGTFSANPQYVKARVIDYMSSLYYIVVAPDGRTIKYWAKYTGIYPTNIPYSAFSYSKGAQEISEVSISFNYASKEDMRMEILEDFNKVSLNIEDAREENPDNSDYLSPMTSYYLKKENIFKLYDQRYGNTGINPIVIAKDNSLEGSSATGSLTNKFQLLFPVDINTLYQTVKFGSDNYYYNYRTDFFRKQFNDED